MSDVQGATPGAITAWIDYIRAVKANPSPDSLGPLVISARAKDAAHWDRYFGLGLGSAGRDNRASVLVAAETKPMGSFLGSLAALDHPDVDRAQVSIYLSVFGEGRRLSPFTQALNGIKPALRILRINEAARHPASIAELSYLYSTRIAVWLADNGFEGTLLKWGDEIQAASWLPSDLDLSDVDVVRFGSPVYDVEALAAQKDWLLYSVADNDLRGLVTRQPSDQLSRRLERLRALGLDLMVNAGMFSLSTRLKRLLLDEFAAELSSDVKVDWDPVVCAALAARTDADWESSVLADDGELTAPVAKTLAAIPDIRERMDRVRSRFKERHGREVRLQAVSMGEMLWLDCGIHRPFFALMTAMLEGDRYGELVREVLGVSATADDRGNRIVNSYVAPTARVRNSLIVDSVISSDASVIDESVIVGSRIGQADLRHKSVVCYSDVGSLRTDGPDAMVYLARTADLVVDTGQRVATTIVNGDAVTLRGADDFSSVSDDEWYVKPWLDNPVSFADASAQADDVTRDPFERLSWTGSADAG